MRELYSISLDGRRYGVWKDEIGDIREAPSVHRLPLSPAAIAGVAVMNGRSTALADLAVCMGLRPAPSGPDRKVLMVSGREDGAGFLVAGAISGASIPDGDVHPVPEYLRTAEADTCVLADGRLVLIINLLRLHDRLQQHSSEPLSPSLVAPPASAGLPTHPGPVRLAMAGGELFAFPDSQLAGSAVRPSGIAAVALAPRHVRGMVFHENRVMPVIHVADRLETAGSRPADLMLAADHAGRPFGLLVEEEQGLLLPASFMLRELPPVAATGWCAAAIIAQGRIVPLLDTGVLVSRKDPEDPVAGLAGRYSPDARFTESFERTEVTVVEFALLGVRHALPRSEVEDVLPYRSYRRLPGALPIVIGAAEVGGEVLPVLDLALVFGRRSLETPDWRMLLVRNGDFRALVITEDVFEERMLPREVQRKVPINLPHRLVYGCYPEGVAVRLILNVAALAVHFDRALVADLLPALTQEMAEAPAELVHSLLPVAGEGLQERVREQAGAEELTRSEAEQRAIREEEERRQREEEERVRQEEAEARRREEAEREKTAAAAQVLKDAEEQARREAEDWARKEEQEQQAREEEEKAKAAAAEEDARRKAEEESRLENERREAEELARRESERAAVESAMRAQQEAEERARQEAEELRNREEAERSRLAAEEQARREAEEKARVAAAEEARRAAEVAAAQAAAEQDRLAKEERLKSESDEREQLAAMEQARLEAEAAQKAEQERLQSEAEEQRRRDEQERAEAAERLKREAEEAKKKEEQERAAAEAERVRLKAEESARRAAEEERLKREAEERARRDAAERARREEQEQRERAEAERARAAAVVTTAQRAGESAPERVVQGTPQDSGVLFDRVRSEQTGAKRSRDGWKLPAAVAAALVILVLLVIGLSGRGVKKSDMAQETAVRPEGPAAAGRPVSEGQGTVGKKDQPQAASEKQEASGKKTSGAPDVGTPAPEDGTVRPNRASRREEKLVLTVPADRPMETDVYLVKKGDTLWHISKRFTGNPFNYPRVAGDNRIANPDLIFPGQRIMLKK